MTRLQKAILEVIKKSKDHLSAKAVYEKVQPEFPSVALGTVYRNLNQFAEDNLIRRVSGLGTSDFYEANIEGHNHSLCITCGSLTDIEIAGIDQLVEKQIKTRPLALDLVVKIICKDCREKQAQSEKDEENGN